MNFSRRKRETRVSLIEICGKLIFGGGRNTRSMGETRDYLLRSLSLLLSRVLTTARFASPLDVGAPRRELSVPRHRERSFSSGSIILRAFLTKKLFKVINMGIEFNRRAIFKDIEPSRTLHETISRSFLFYNFCRDFFITHIN